MSESAMIVLVVTDDSHIPQPLPARLSQAHKRRWVIVAVIVVVLIIVGVIAVLLWRAASYTNTKTPMTDAQYTAYVNAKSFADLAEKSSPVTKALDFSTAGDFMDQAGKYEDALTYYKKAQSVVDTNNLQNKENLNYYEKIADEYKKLGNTSNARTYYNKAIKFIKSLPDSQPKTDTLKSLEKKRGDL